MWGDDVGHSSFKLIVSDQTFSPSQDASDRDYYVMESYMGAFSDLDQTPVDFTLSSTSKTSLME